jgi:hypothetical protein
VQHAQDQERHQREAAEDAQTQEEITRKRQRAGQATTESGDATLRRLRLKEGQEQANEQLNLVEGLIPGLQDVIKTTAAKLAEAQLNAQAHPAPTEAAPTLFEDPTGARGIGYNYRLLQARKAKEELDQAQAASDTAKSTLEKQEKLRTKYQIQLDEIDRDIAAQEQLAHARSELARKLREEADEAEQSLRQRQQSRAGTDQTHRQTEVVERLSSLANASDRSPQESAELNAAKSSQRLSEVMKDVAQRLAQIRTDRGLGQDVHGQVEELLGEIMGTVERIVMQPGLRNAGQYEQRLQAVEEQLDQQQSQTRNNR